MHIYIYICMFACLHVFFLVHIYIQVMCVIVYVCTLHIYTCACSLSSNLIDLSSALTCAHWHVVRLDMLALRVWDRGRGDGARACCAWRIARGGRQGTHTHACALGHVLYEGCVCDYEEHEDDDDLCACM
jgi:hypothetical protein